MYLSMYLVKYILKYVLNYGHSYLIIIQLFFQYNIENLVLQIKLVY